MKSSTFSFFVLIGLLCLAPKSLLAQNFLILQKSGKPEKVMFYETGDQLVYQQKGFDYLIKDQIIEITSEAIVLEDNILLPDQIEKIDIRDHPQNQTFDKLKTIFFGAGLLLLTAETINGIYQDQKLSYDRGVLITGGSLLGAGILFSQLKPKFFKNEGNKQIKIIYLSPEEE
ncbi:hypothetical protein QWY93_11140 [Echinicola jeungdonensis]|uniref:Uncharacterized protein n=1 Tax=Echinicola jeungdonensis TaxID=709343 RepID=A0ABV5J655_9BACT|nr:hypothetical protein [Echinicola jeungdonensis]MDN3669879.1 hypothetical protein [Echinicola jeungdonensis]